MTVPGPAMLGRFRVGGFEIDLDRRSLSRDGVEVGLRRKAFELLAHLVQHAHRVVTRDELLAAVWPGVNVSEATLASTLRTVREALGESQDAAPLIRTLRGRGYRFEGELEELFASAASASRSLDPHPVVGSDESAFVGRGDLLARGLSTLETALGGRAHVLMLAGEAGIGKSRALRELSQLASRQGFALLAGRCLEEDGAPACWPWIQIIREILDEQPAEERAAFCERHAAALVLLPERASASTDRVTADDESAAAARFRIFDAIAALMRERAQAKPLAILLDDLHRADSASVSLLRHLVGSLAGAPLAVLGTLRGSEVPQSHPMASFLSELHTVGSLVEMRGLDVEEVGQLLESLWGRAPLQRVAEAVHARSGGNALFAGEIARWLDRAGATDSAEQVVAAAPSGVRQAIRARVARLPAEAAVVLEMASVIGRDLSLDVLRWMCAKQEVGGPEPALEAARQAGFVVEEPAGSGHLRFAHILIRDVLYEDVPLERRAGLHRAAGLAIEALHPLEPEAHAEELAHHFAQALPEGEAERAQRFARLAGEQAFARAAYDEAARSFEAALYALGLREGVAEGQALPAWATRERIELQILRGRATWLGGSTEAARKIFLDAAQAAEDVSLPELLGRAALGYAGRTDATPGVNRPAVRLMERALALLPSQDDALRAELLARLGTELYYDAKSSRGEALAEEALAMAERVGDAGVLAYAISARHYTLMRAEIDPRRRGPLLARLKELAHATGARDTLALGLQEEVVDRLELGERGKLDSALRQYRSLAEELRQPFFLWMAGAYAGMCALLDGRVDDAERLVHETLARGQQCSSPNALPMFASQLYHLRCEQGRSRELEPMVAAAIEEQEVFPSFRAGLAAIQAAAGRKREAAATLADLMSEDLDDVPRDSNWLMLLSVLTGPAVAVRDETLLSRLRELFLPYVGRVIAGGHASSCAGSVDHQLGMLCAALNDNDAADEYFEAAERIHQRLRARLWLAHTEREHARLLWKSGMPHERERAHELAERACATYQSAELPHQVAATRAGLR